MTKYFRYGPRFTGRIRSNRRKDEEQLKITMKPTNKCVIEVEPRDAGNFGIVYMSGFSRSEREEYQLCQEIERNIKRHVDDIGHTYINQKHVYETEDGEKFETLYEALEYLYDEDGCVADYEIGYQRPNDAHGTRSREKSFEDVITTAFKNPFNFQVLRGKLTEEQQKFLDRVVAASISEKMPKSPEPTA